VVPAAGAAALWSNVDRYIRVLSVHLFHEVNPFC